MQELTTITFLCKCGCGQIVPLSVQPSQQRQYIRRPSTSGESPIGRTLLGES